MPPRAVHRAYSPLALVSLMLASPLGCVAALDLDDYRGAVASLCVCDQIVPQFGGRCVEILEGRLASVTPERRADFLALYADRCADSCDEAESCYQHEALCTPEGRECSEDRECCGFPSGVVCDPTTRLCRAP